MKDAASDSSSARGWLWLQLAIAWVPMWALFTAMIVIAHGIPFAEAVFASLRMVLPGAALAVAVYKFATHTPWPHPFRLRFVGAHVLAAAAFALVWYVSISVIDSIVTGRLTLRIGPGIGLFLITGVWLYIIVAVIAYANLGAQRSARVQAHAARAQLDALRAQLHPHFLFNALHTVVQLIPTDPRSAVRAAEQLAAALRTAVEEHRDVVPLRDEWAFVERYLALERIRCGDRLRIDESIDAAARDALLPSFALQTLVENAVRHGAAPRIAPTTLTISARLDGTMLCVTVRDDGEGTAMHAIESGTGTGLRRLRERMCWLYGEAAHIDISSAAQAGFTATLHVPQSVRHDD